MAITDRTRKILWAKSGNRCAICRRELILNASRADSEAVVGDECHIIARSPGGPRGSLPIEEDPDAYNNLILLCKADHKRVDDQPNAFSPDRLRTMKREHEAWVQCQLSANPRPRMRVFKAPDERNGIDIIVVPTGKILLSIIGRCMEGYYDSDELETDEEVDLVGGFLQEVRDWNDILDETEVDGRFRAELSLTRSIRALCDAGWVVYAGRLERILDVDGKRSPWPVSVVHVFRLANARPREEAKA